MIWKRRRSLPGLLQSLLVIHRLLMMWLILNRSTSTMRLLHCLRVIALCKRSCLSGKPRDARSMFPCLRSSMVGSAISLKHGLNSSRLGSTTEQTVRSQMDFVKGPNAEPNHSKKAKPKSKGNETKSPRSTEGKISREKLTQKEKDFLNSNIKRGGGLIIHENVRSKWGWIQWAKKIGVCIKCAGKGHNSEDCTVSVSKPEKLNTVGKDNSVDSVMDSDHDYLCSIHNRQKDILLKYHCEINKRKGTVLLDTGATKNYISRRFAEKANLKFRGYPSALRSVKLPNGQVMKILGECEFTLIMSEWTGTVVATVLDLEADFDVVLGMSWHLQWKPLYDWETLDVFVNAPEGAKRIVHKFGFVKRLVNGPILTSLADWPEDLQVNAISFQDAEREIKGGAKAYLYF
ncbi:MAG: retroviral-like aspartic protease, partial [Chloroflexi bacterium]